MRKSNIYHSKIPEFNFRNADEEDWTRLNLEFDKVDWTNLLENQSPEEMTTSFLNKVLEKVSLVLKKKPQFEESPNEETKENSFSSKNRISRKIIILMRNKSKAPKSLLRTKSKQRYLILNYNIEAIEKELKDSYEQEALKKIKKDPKAFFGYAKKFSKSSSDVGPFLNKSGDVVKDGATIADMLKQQYESVYSTPVKKMEISNPLEFFSKTKHLPNWTAYSSIEKICLKHWTNLPLVSQQGQMEFLLSF